MSNFFKKLAIGVINLYRNYISPLMLPRCRYYPSCSEYAKEAIEKKGIWQGSWMAAKRLSRCHPFNKDTFYDPVK